MKTDECVALRLSYTRGPRPRRGHSSQHAPAAGLSPVPCHRRRISHVLYLIWTVSHMHLYSVGVGLFLVHCSHAFHFFSASSVPSKNASRCHLCRKYRAGLRVDMFAREFPDAWLPLQVMFWATFENSLACLHSDQVVAPFLFLAVRIPAQDYKTFFVFTALYTSLKGFGIEGSALGPGAHAYTSGHTGLPRPSLHLAATCAANGCSHHERAQVRN